jgi:hypothetical protein
MLLARWTVWVEKTRLVVILEIVRLVRRIRPVVGKLLRRWKALVASGREAAGGERASGGAK